MPPKRIEPGPGQESVWDYPRPPRIEPARRRVRVIFSDQVVVDSTRALRVLETYGAPVYYLPADDVRRDLLVPSAHRTFCEWKGWADHLDLVSDGRVAERAAWVYRTPSPGFEPIAGHLAFYVGRVDRCLLDEEQVRPQPGAYYGGWVTDDVVGPFKGEAGTEGW